MKFKKTIAAMAITASSAFALVGPVSATKTLCLNAQEDNDGALYAGRCDETQNNITLNRKILSNGCAEEQIALTALKFSGSKKFDIEIGNCMPPNVVQL